MLGSSMKQRIFMRAAIFSHPTFSTKSVNIFSKVMPCKGSFDEFSIIYFKIKLQYFLNLATNIHHSIEKAMLSYQQHRFSKKKGQIFMPFLPIFPKQNQPHHL